MKAYKAIIIIFLILAVDQAVKFWIKTNMYLGQEYHVFGNWFIIHFTENEGMAFGLRFGGGYGKLLLSIFRLIAVGFICYYLSVLIRQKTYKGLIISISLILAGAIGNIIDSVFYGVIFSGSYHYEIASLFPEQGGYSTLLHGKVVDMLYFPLWNGVLPDWLPFWGGGDFIFFRPIFNIADSSITIGVLLILIFQKRFFKSNKKELIKKEDTSSADPEMTAGD